LFLYAKFPVTHRWQPEGLAMRLYQTGALLTGAHSELVPRAGVLAMVGLPAAEILEAATLRAARALGVDDRTGTIEPGGDADLIAVRGDPRSDISVLHHVELVVARGAEHRPAPHRVQAGALAAPAGPGPR
jgi:adenine deaminase